MFQSVGGLREALHSTYNKENLESFIAPESLDSYRNLITKFHLKSINFKVSGKGIYFRIFFCKK